MLAGLAEATGSAPHAVPRRLAVGPPHEDDLVAVDDDGVRAGLRVPPVTRSALRARHRRGRGQRGPARGAETHERPRSAYAGADSGPRMKTTCAPPSWPRRIPSSGVTRRTPRSLPSLRPSPANPGRYITMLRAIRCGAFVTRADPVAAMRDARGGGRGGARAPVPVQDEHDGLRRADASPTATVAGFRVTGCARRCVCEREHLILPLRARCGPDERR